MRKKVGPNSWDMVILCDACRSTIMSWTFSCEPYDVLTVRGKKGKVLHYCSKECCAKHFHGGRGEMLVKKGDHPRDRQWIPLDLLV